MKKSFLKIVSLGLTLCMMLSVAIPMFTVSATEADTTTSTSTNLISGLVPYEAYRSETGVTGVIKSGNIEVQGASSAFYPYYTSWPDNKTALEPYLSTITDADTTSGYAYAVYSGSRGLTFIYDLGQMCKVDGFSIDISHYNGTSPAGVKVHIFASENRDDLFTTEITSGSTDYSYGIDLTMDNTARYVAVIFEQVNSYYYVKINDMAFTGEKIVNVLEGVYPIQLHTTAQDTTTHNYKRATINDYINNGYDIGWAFENFYTWKPYTALLTDGDSETSFTMTVENGNNYDITMVYELKANTDVYAVEMVAGGYTNDLAIYASSSRDDIFSGEPVANVTREKNAYTSGPYVKVDAKNTRYIGVHFKYFYQNNFSELLVYGTENEEVKPSLISGKKPVAMYAIREDNNELSWTTNVKLGGTNYAWFGTTKPETVDSTTYAVLDYLTDEYLETSLGISDQLDKDFEEDTAIVYQLDSLSAVSAVKLAAATALGDADVYMSKGYASLFRSDSKVASFTADGTATSNTFNLDTPEEALYIGIILDTDYGVNYNLSTIDVYGEALETIVNETVLGGTSPVNANANDATKSFYQYLNNVGESENVLIGAHVAAEAQLVNLSQSNNYYNYVEKTYGVSPAVVSLGEGYTKTVDGEEVYVQYTPDVYAQYYNQGAIPLIPILGGIKDMECIGEDITPTTYIKYLDKTYVPTEEDDEELIAAMQSEYDDMLMEAANLFVSLEENGVNTYMVRPFNEMNISGFYGDAYNDVTQHFKNVWQQMVDYFVVDWELTGILFVYSPSTITSDLSQSIMSMYPGDDYVDVIAPTVYPMGENSFLKEIPDYDEILATGRPFGMSEIGMTTSYTDSTTVYDCMDLLESLKVTYKEACFASMWFGNHAINKHDNAEKFITDEYILNTENMVNHQFENVQPIARVALSDTSGNTTKLAYGEYMSADLAELSIDALDIYDGAKITVYAEDNCAGDSWVFGRDVSSLAEIDVTIISVKVEKAEEFTVANINSDESVNILDFIAIKKDFSAEKSRNELASDIDNNGKVNSNDITLLCKILLGVYEI